MKNWRMVGNKNLDTLVKQRLQRLPAAVERALGEARDRRERRRAEERQRLLVGELDHRVKNVLATVRSLILRCRAMARLVPPRATRTSTSTSLAESGPGDRSTVVVGTGVTRSTSGRAPSSTKVARAAASSSSAVSRSPRAWQTSASRTRVRAPSYGVRSSLQERHARRASTVHSIEMEVP